MVKHSRCRELRAPARAGRRRACGGFTILELLVALVISAVLAVAVFPRVARWIEQADATRSAADLTALRTGIQAFEVNVRRHPSRLSHLTTPITASDVDLDGLAYGSSAAGRWKGPYLSTMLPDVALSEPVLHLPSGGTIANEVVCFDPGSGEYGCGPNTVIAVITDGVRGSDFELINDVVDGDDEPTGSTGAGQSRTAGKLQYIGDGVSLSLTIGTMIYIITPYAP